MNKTTVVGGLRHAPGLLEQVERHPLARREAEDALRRAPGDWRFVDYTDTSDYDRNAQIVKGSTIGAGTTGSGHTLAPLRGHNGSNIASPPPASAMVPLYTGAIFQVADWHCMGHDDGNHREEWCDAYEVAVTRRGVYSREVGRMHVVADASTVVFWNDAEAYRIRHPVPGGDDCSIFRFRQGAFREFITSLAPRLSDAETLRRCVP